MKSIRTRLSVAIASLGIAVIATSAFAGGDSGNTGGAQPDPALRVEAPAPASTPAPTPVEPTSLLPPPNPVLRLAGGDGSDGGDSYQLTAHLEDGSFLLVRVLITNAGPGDRNAIATGLWIESDGTAHNFDNVRRSSEWQLAPDRKRFDIGTTHLDVSGDYARYWIDKKRIQVDVQLPLSSGIGLPDGFEPEGASADLLAALVPIVGTIKLAAWDAARDVRGTATLVHGWSKSANFGNARRVSAAATAGSESLMVLQQQVPGGTSRGLVLYRSTAGRLQIFESVIAEAEGRLPGDRPDSYPTPAAIALSGAQAEGRVLMGDVLFERDLIGSLPLAMRTVMGFTLRSRPRRVWARASIDVTLRSVSGGTPRRFQGEGTAAIAFSDTFSGR